MNGINRLCRSALMLLAIAGATAPAFAEDYPARPVTIITPFAAGSATDTAARLIGKYLQEALGQPFIDRKSRGRRRHAVGGRRSRTPSPTAIRCCSPRTARIRRRRRCSNTCLTIRSRISRRSRASAAFPPSSPSITICRSTSMAELVAYAKANPGKLDAGYGNSTGRITVETIKRRLNLDIVPVAYRSNPAAVTDLMAGHIQMGVPDFSHRTADAQGRENPSARRADQRARPDACPTFRPWTPP